MKKRDERFVETLVGITLWAAFAVAGAFYLATQFGLPTPPAAPDSSMVDGVIGSWVPWLGLIFFLTAAAFVILRRKKRSLLARQEDVAGVRNLSWQGFETLVAEAYRREGYSVWKNSALGPDGGVDLVARKDGDTVLVQCREWKASDVAVRTVRETFGFLNAERAKEIHVVTGGHFTEEARAFAANKPIRLIDGLTLKGMIGNVQMETTKETPPETVAAPVAIPQKRRVHADRKWARGRHAPSP